jgi:type II secretory ATPase GspE/PulE/Tfp pilus assembly ATPase PilB-like protein
MADPPSSAVPNDLSALELHSGIEAVDKRLDTAQMLSLIDSIFPFEACLYHEIIPLSVESSFLHLGMVTPSDSAAIAYARRQASFIQRSIVPWPVASDWQRNMLSQYLSYATHNQLKSPTPAALSAGPSSVGNGEELHPIADRPQDLPTPPLPAPASPAGAILTVGTPTTATPIGDPNPLSIDLDPALGLVPLQQIGQLPPPQIIQALLLRVIADGIGRIFLERRSDHGRILWSQDGVVQAALDPLPLVQFQSILNEFKRLAHLPLLPTSRTQQADIERLYKGERVMLRLRLILGTQGEEATLQVLRGAALKFYQQHKIKQMGEDALGIAHTLQKRITAIREQARQALTIEAPSSHTLESLCAMLKTMDEQIQEIMRSPHPPDR